MKNKIARLASDILNPFVITIGVLIVLSLKEGNGIPDMLKWLLITVVISVVPVIIIVFVLVRKKKLDSFYSNPREQRNIVYILSSVLAAIDCFFIWYFHAPKLLAVIFTAGLVAVIIFMIINYFWKISLHTAFITAAIVVLILEYGPWALWSSTALLLVAWSRVVLKQHNILQVCSGGILAAVIVFLVFWSFGLVGIN